MGVERFSPSADPTSQRCPSNLPAMVSSLTLSSLEPFLCCFPTFRWSLSHMCLL